MPSGLQIWDATGVLIVDTSTSVAALLGVETGRTSGFSITNDLFYKGTPWYFYVPRAVYSLTSPANGIPSVSFAGNTMTVSGSGFDGTFFYGVY